MDTTKRLTASERDSLVRLNVAAEILILDVREQLQARARLVPYARRDMAMLSAVAHRLLDGFLATIPADQLLTYQRSLQMTSYTVGIKRPGTTGTRNERDYGIWLPFEALNELLVGCHDHCMMCSDDKAQRRACRLRKALELIPNDTEGRADGDCPFYTIL